MVPSVMATSYSRPVRLSRMLSESVMGTTYAGVWTPDQLGGYDPHHADGLAPASGRRSDPGSATGSAEAFSPDFDRIWPARVILVAVAFEPARGRYFRAGRAT